LDDKELTCLEEDDSYLAMRHRFASSLPFVNFEMVEKPRKGG